LGSAEWWEFFGGRNLGARGESVRGQGGAIGMKEGVAECDRGGKAGGKGRLLRNERES